MEIEYPPRNLLRDKSWVALPALMDRIPPQPLPWDLHPKLCSTLTPRTIVRNCRIGWTIGVYTYTLVNMYSQKFKYTLLRVGDHFVPKRNKFRCLYITYEWSSTWKRSSMCSPELPYTSMHGALGGQGCALEISSSSPVYRKNLWRRMWSTDVGLCFRNGGSHSDKWIIEPLSNQSPREEVNREICQGLFVSNVPQSITGRQATNSSMQEQVSVRKVWS